ncbi:MAG: type II toxin-antitoxin system RelE/ParE family toxin [Bacteroidota bacterium]
MPDKYSLRYLPIAQDDLISIFDWIAQDSPNRALLFIEKLDKLIGLLEKQPLLGREPRHTKLKEYGYLTLIIDSYLIFYILRKQTIEIHRIIHATRNLDDLL